MCPKLPKNSVSDLSIRPCCHSQVHEPFSVQEGDAYTVNFPTLLAADDGSVLTVILLKCHTCDSVGGVKSTHSGPSGDVMVFSHNFRCGSAVL